MKLTREQGLFLVVLVLVAFLGRGWFGDRGSERAGSPKGRDLPPLRTLDPARSAVGKEGYVPEGRSPFAQPRDTRPLPPLPLEPPPLDPLPILVPPGFPHAAVKRFGDFYRIPYAPLSLPPEDGAGGQAGEASPATAPLPAEPEDRASRVEAWKRQYDWHRVALGYEFGHILNPDRFRLRDSARAAEPLRFVPVDPAKGKPISGEIQVPREQNGQAIEFGFADTLANRIEERFVTLRYNSGNIPDLLAFAEWCLEKGVEEPKAFAHAEQVYREIVKLDPGDPAGALGLGRLLERAFRLEEAWDHYRSMAEGPFKQRAAPHARLGTLAARLDLPERAEEEFREALRLEPTVPEAHAGFGEFLLADGRVEEALPECESALRLEPTAAAAKARIRSLLGRARLAAGDPAGARRAFEQALEAVPGDPSALAGRAACSYAVGDFASAIEDASRGISAGTGTVDLYLARGLARLRLAFARPAGESGPPLREAETDLRAAGALDPLRTGEGDAALAFLFQMAGRNEEALQALEEALEEDPTDPYTLYLRGRLLRERGEIDGAKESLAAALDHELDFPDALAERGMVALSEGRTDDARRYLARAASLAPKEPSFRLLLGTAALLAGENAVSEDHFRQVVAIERDSGAARNGLGVCAYARGDTPAALKQFSEVIDRFKNRPDSPHARYAKETFDRISDHWKKVEWVDDFERADLRNGWIVEAEAGLTIRPVNGHVSFEGSASREGEARVYREIATRDFVSFEATLLVGTEDQSAACGIFLSSESSGGGGKVGVNFRADVARTRDGEVLCRLTTNPRERAEPIPAPPGVTWKKGSPVRLSIERAGTSDDPRLRITVDGEPIFDKPVREFRGVSGYYRIGVFVQMEGAGRGADVSFDSVRLVYRQG
ncbi:MAG TPA: tetratricopeptide repeat protein [Planctomycetota bacterium]|jgi:tetratricopeptide (TPR) repeat protein|nr:tetratricopeptide repeat protein [Planctomycetota bacterium]